MPPLRVAVLFALLICVPIHPDAAPSASLVPGPAGCALELQARDASGNTVLTTVAYALDRPGLVLAPLSVTARRRPRWERLQTVPDAGLSGAPEGRVPLDVTEVLLQDAGRDLLLLRAPGLEACVPVSAVPGDDPPGGAPAPPPAVSLSGGPLTGIRDRDGYRPRLFEARLDRTIAVGAGSDLLRVRISDGGGAESGFLFDRYQRLYGSILPPPPGGDRSFACVVPIDRREIDAAASGPGLPVPDALARPAQAATYGASGLWARALLLTLDSQADAALRLLDEAERLAGETDDLLMERGSRLFRIGRIDAAIADFSRAAQINPRLHLALFNLGVTYGSAGRYDEAIDALSRAAAIDPGHARTHYQLALALRAGRRMDGARREYERLGEIDPGLARDLREVLAF